MTRAFLSFLIWFLLVQPAWAVVYNDDVNCMGSFGMEDDGNETDLSGEGNDLTESSGDIPQEYYKDPAKSAETFVVAKNGTRYAIPGDWAQLEADGTITLLGRGSVSINSGGEKIYPEEVEKALKQHPSVSDAVVVGTPNERFGQQVTAVVQMRPGDPAIADELIAFAGKHLARYKLPRTIVFVDQIVRSPAGKADYRWTTAIARKALGIEPNEP